MSESTIQQVADAMNAGQGQETPPVETPDQGAVQTSPVGDSGTAAGAPSDFAQGILKGIPDAERPIVEKYIKTWDQQVQQRFNSVHSEYEPWKPLKDAGLDANEVQQLVALGEALNANPLETVQAIVEAYNLQAFMQQQGAPGQPQTPQIPQPTQEQIAQQVTQTGQVTTPEQKQWFEQLPPEVQQRLAMVDTMAQLLLQQQEQAQNTEADQQLDSMLAQLKETHGDFNEKWVLTLASQTGDLEGAVQEYKAEMQRLMAAGNAPNANAPVVLGSGGGLPASDIDPAKLGSKETKQLVAGMLDAANKPS